MANNDWKVKVKFFVIYYSVTGKVIEHFVTTPNFLRLYCKEMLLEIDVRKDQDLFTTKEKIGVLSYNELNALE